MCIRDDGTHGYIIIWHQKWRELKRNFCLRYVEKFHLRQKSNGNYNEMLLSYCQKKLFPRMFFVIQIGNWMEIQHIALKVWVWVVKVDN